MTDGQYNFQPNYTIHPGQLLEQELEHRGLSQAEFASLVAQTPELVSEIIAGNVQIDMKTATQFEHALGIGADVWLRMEADYQASKAGAARDD